MSDALARALSGAPDPIELDGPGAWWAQHLDFAKDFHKSSDVALVGGFLADRLGWAFASGYQAAGEAAFGAHLTGARRPTALCATEAGGAHPRAIATTLVDGRVDGTKAFVTLGPFAERLLVVASTGEVDGQNQLKVALVDARHPGVSLHATPELPFTPELPHASVELRDVPALIVLPGDGYTAYLKPFRTIEDTHVHLALCGYQLQVARRCGFGADLVAALAAQALALTAIARRDPASPATHVALGGAIASAETLIERCAPAWSQVDGVVHARWTRDQGLLRVAGGARARRLEVAWARLKGSTGGRR